MQLSNRGLSLVGIGIILALFASSIPASFAHPVYVRSTPQAFQSVPASPSEVSIFFTEPIELKYSKISVLSPDGSEVSKNDPHNVGGDTASLGVSLQPGLPDGTYTVSTKVLSAVDGHSVDNAFTFGVGLGTKLSSSGPEEQSTQNLVSIPEVVSRYPGLIGQVMIVGGAFATLWLWKPIARVRWLSDAITEKKIAIDRTMLKFVILGVILVLASGVAMIVGTSKFHRRKHTRCCRNKVWQCLVIKNATIRDIGCNSFYYLSKGRKEKHKSAEVRDASYTDPWLCYPCYIESNSPCRLQQAR